MEAAVPTSSTPVSGPQPSGPDFAQRLDLDPDVIAEVREALKRDWHTRKRFEDREQLVCNWSPLGSCRGSRMIPLESRLQERGNRLPGIDKRSESSFYNKATAFYWMQSATIIQGDADGLAIVGSIWNTWTDALGREPQFYLDAFFAVPVSVTEKIAKTVPEILRAHKYICSQVRGTLEEKGAGAKTDPRYFRLYPLCEALIAVFDEYKFVASGFERQADGHRHYDNVAQHQSLLLVRTGKEDGLSAPISFDSLKHEALPLARNEDMGVIDIIRIPLQVGVRFIANLLLREEAAFPESALGGPHLSKEPDHPLKKYERKGFDWGEGRLASAQALGKISSSSTATDVKKAALGYSRLKGEPTGSPPSFKFNWV